MLGVSKVNIMLAEMYFSDTSQHSMLDFRKQLVETELIHNTYYEKENDKTIRKNCWKIEAHSHAVLSLPKKQV